MPTAKSKTALGNTAFTPPSNKRLTITEVALKIGKRYAKTRDMMLAGRFGKAKLEGRTLTVAESGVDEWLVNHGPDAKGGA